MPEFMWSLLLWAGMFVVIAGIGGAMALGLYHWYLYIRHTYFADTGTDARTTAFFRRRQ